MALCCIVLSSVVREAGYFGAAMSEFVLMQVHNGLTIQRSSLAIEYTSLLRTVEHLSRAESFKATRTILAL